jgi:hypothetical protein
MVVINGLNVAIEGDKTGIFFTPRTVHRETGLANTALSGASLAIKDIAAIAKRQRQ